jgi:hypothetical protein
LTRRANHLHIFILARILEPAAGENGRGLFQSGGGRIRDAPSPHVSALSQDAFASAPPSEPLLAFAGVRERAGMRRGTNPRPHAVSPARDRVRARNDRVTRSCRIFFHCRANYSVMPEPDPGIHRMDCRIKPGDVERGALPQEAGMTAYLISLALTGLTAIAVWEMCA